jgi:hypothetical protein
MNQTTDQTTTTNRPKIFVWIVRVRDVYCGVRGEYVEEIDVLREDEAKKWLREWKSMYSREDGFSVTMKQELR